MAEEQAIRKALADGDEGTLQAANSHTDSEVASEHSNSESGDQNTLDSAKAYADAAVAAVVNGSPAAIHTLRELADAWGGPRFCNDHSRADRCEGR